MDHRQHDVVIVGGGAAGLAAAVQLARSRRSVVVVDGGEPRNAPAAHMHSYLGHDGRPPLEFLELARDEARRYGAELVEGVVREVTRAESGGGFAVVLGDGGRLEGRRVLFATGLVDELPDLPGVAEQWGRGVLHCPYCHGWEVRDQRIAVLATGPMSVHQALLFRQLSDRVSVVAHDPAALDAAARTRLDARGVRVVDRRAAAVEASPEGTLRGVRLDDGDLVEADAVVVTPRFVPRAAPLRGLGIEPVPAPMGTGEMVETDDRGATTVPGVYAAGNVADVSHQVLGAAAEGSRIGAVINADLVEEDVVAALEAAVDGSGAGWDRRYAQRPQRWSGHPNATLVAEVADLAPGTALDVGCGEGADAVWLAQRGWRVTGLDVSAVALERAARAAQDAGVEIELVRADVTDTPLEGRYDLVTAHYPSLPRGEGDAAVRALLDAVAPGGTLLFVGHDPDAMEHHHAGFDPAEHVQPGDVARHLGAGWIVEVHETRPRALPPGSTGPDVPDVVLRARRS